MSFRNQALVGQKLDVLIEGAGDGISVGRSYRDAPEIDGMVIVEGERQAGEMLGVRISGAMTYDLTGHPADLISTGAIPLEILPGKRSPKKPF